MAIRKEDIGQWLSANSDLSKVSERDLRELADTYPYSEMLQWLYLKKLYVEDDVRFEARLEQVAMQVSSRRQLYYYLTADAASVAVEAVTGLEQLGGLTGDYVSIMDSDTKKASLQELAAKLRAARLAKAREVQQLQRVEREETTPVVLSEPVAAVNEGETCFDEQDFGVVPATAFTEEEVKKLLRERKYADALEILEELYLRNPKKSSYFAIQIKFVKTILENNK